ncbi:2-hydroxychromene-2-carboxylate isomerase [Tistlia consotensis]|uniref:2-hydroxychromene-2-carboxylate isomerase n=1 Tax=Tistlia consotensis USBA 355 TaxID=560819 RepID=A0A1Y6CKB9_9PROT|nr:2-hydroxychromene-2-carboxylate isomerase [Tistlia consotensis]SMF72491.1 2-hydroxychromene-2-carboxylate isomerase [Tistlia consotensis USBA 355]SNS09226.1 2-hydroxychromene-2-carboxylate isomerase [Tistlia consotensis]
MAHIDYYLSLNSPWAYLGAARLRELAARAGASVKVKPADYRGTVFPATGGLSLPQRPPARQAYRMMELKRWPAVLGIPLTLSPKHFPFDETAAAGLVVAADLSGGDPLLLSEAILRALWAEERDPGDPATLKALAEEIGHDGDALTARAAESDVAETLSRYNEEALAAGVFGAPSYVVEGEIFWGQDRLGLLERKLGVA